MTCSSCVVSRAFDRVALLIDERLVAGLPALQEHVRLAAEARSYDLQVVPVTDDIPATVAAIPDDVQAVMVGFMGYLSDEQFAALSGGLISRRLPSYAVFGRPDVERGLMLGVAPGSDFQRIGRRVAINIQRILLGENASELSIDLAQNNDVTFNMATARAIGYSPTFELLTEATVLFEERLDLAREITLAQAVQEALEHQREQLRLDVIAEAAIAFLDVLRAGTGEGVRKQNLSLTRTNLDLSRVRQSIGTANPAEVFRWESQVATERSQVISASALRNQAEIALNRILNRPLEESFRAVDQGIGYQPVGKRRVGGAANAARPLSQRPDQLQHLP